MAWTFVQAPTPVIATGGTSTTIALTSVTTGDVIVVVAKSDATGTISDNLVGSGSWTEPAGSPWATNKHVYYKVSTATGAMTITVAVGGAAATIRVSARQYTPPAGTVSLDGAITTVTNAAAIASPISIGPTPSLLAGDLVVAGDAGSGVNAQSAGAAAPNTNLAQLANASGAIATEDSTNWTGGAATATFSWTGTNQVDGVVIALKTPTPFIPPPALVVDQAVKRGFW